MERLRIPELDGLRGIAILMVVAGHYALGADLAGAGPLKVFAFRLLNSGVDLFFVLSGFLITGILLEARGAPHYFRTFYGRRICRIFPLYYLLLTVVCVQGALWRWRGHPNTFYDASMPFWMFPLFLQNFGMAWFPDAAAWIVLGMTWSLAVEEQFYATLPALVRTMRPAVIAAGCVLLIATAAVARCLIVPREHSVGALALAAVRADALAAGIVLAIAFQARAPQRRKAVASVVAIAAAAVLLTEIRLTFLRETALIGVYAGTVWLAAGGGIVFLRARILRFFGMISYALYLCHQLVLVTMHSLLRHSVPSFDGAGSRLVTGLAFGLSLALCTASWMCLERPLIRWGHRRYSYQ